MGSLIPFSVLDSLLALEEINLAFGNAGTILGTSTLTKFNRCIYFGYEQQDCHQREGRQRRARQSAGSRQKDRCSALDDRQSAAPEIQRRTADRILRTAYSKCQNAKGARSIAQRHTR